MRKAIFAFLAVFICSVALSQSPTIQASGNLCEGGSVTLTVNGAPANATFQWTKDGNPIASEISSSLTVTTAGKYDVLVNGTATGTPIDVIVNPKPNVDFTFTPAAGCGKTKINFTSTSNDGGTPASTNGLQYQWDFGDGSATSNSAAPSHTFNPGKGTGATSFNVKLTVTNSNGCSASTTKTVSIGKSPDATLNGPNATVINGEPYFKICSATGQTFSFTNGSSTILTNTQYVIRWGDASPDSVFSNFTSVIKHPYSVGLKSLTFIAYSGSCVDSTVYNIFVGNVPAGGIAGIGGSTICAGDAQKFVISGTENNPPGTLYVLQYKDGTKNDSFYHPAPDTVTHIFPKTSCGTNSSNGSQTFTNSFGAYLTITNPCGSAGGSILPIYVSEKPKADFSISRNGLCEGQTVSFTNTGLLGNNVENGTCTPGKVIWRIRPSTAGSWTLGFGSSLGNDFGDPDPNLWTAGSNTLNVTFNKQGVYTITLVMANNTLCGADSIVKTICVNPSPTASFSLDNISGCTPLNVVVTNSSSTPNCGQNSYQWTVSYLNTSGCTPNTPGVTYINGTNQTSVNPQFSFTNPGVYTITLTTLAPGGACSSTAQQTVTVKTKPVVIITVPSSVCQGGSLSPTASVYNCYSSTAASYVWTFTGATPASSTSTTPGSITYPNTGPYSVKLDVTNECGTTSGAQNVTVNPLPTLNVPSDQMYCSGQATGGFTFTASAGSTVSWSRTSGNIGGSLALTGSGSIANFNATNTTSSPISSTFTVTATTLNNCTVTKNFKVTVNPTPLAPTANSVTYCQNEPSIPLSATASSGNTLNWYTSSTGIPSPTAPTPTTDVVGTTNFYVSQTNAYGCESPKATITVSVLAKPSISLNTSSAPTGCGLNTGSITINGLISGTTYIISYSKNGGTPITTTQTVFSTSYKINNLGAGTYDNIKVTAGSCTSNILGPITLADPNPPPTPTASSNGPICAGNNLTLLATTTATGTVSYQWTGPNFSSSTQSPTIPNATIAASGKYSVTVTVANCSSQAGTVDVVVNPTPNITSISSNTPLCVGKDLNLTAVVSGTPTTSYSWSGPNSFTSTLLTPTVQNVGLADAGSYTLTATDGSCSSNKNTSVVVNPVPSITASGTDPSTCGGYGTITINGLTTSGTYSVWYLYTDMLINKTYTASGGQITIPNLFPGTYTNISVALTPNGCRSNSVSQIILKNPTPPPTPVATTDAPVCSGGTLNLFASDIPNATYQWTGPNNFSKSIQNPSIASVSTLASGTYKVTATVSGCVSSEGSVDVVINPTPSINPISSISVCEGSDVNLTATVTAPTGTTYHWTGPNSFTSDQLSASIPKATTDASGIYILTATSGTCSSSKSTTVTVNVVPNITATKAEPTQCNTLTGTITITGNNLTGTYTVKYTKDGTPFTKTLTANSGSIVIPALPAGSYDNITITPATSTCISNSFGPLVLNDPLPPSQPTISTNNSPICAGSTLTLVATGAPTGATYSWTTPSGNVVGDTYSLPNAQTTASGTYNVKTLLNGCSSTFASTTVVVNPIPAQPTVGSNSPVCEGNTLNLTANSTTSGVTYAWTGPNSYSSTDQNPSIPTIQTSASGAYTVIAKSAQGCPSLAKTLNITINPLPTFNVSVTQPTSCAQANGVITIANLSSAGSYMIQYSKDGVQVPPFSKTPTGGTIILTALPPGTYSNLTLSINGCPSLPRGPYTLNVPAPPPAPVIATNNSPLCSGGTLILTASGAPVGGTYSWATPSGTVVTGATLTISNAATSSSGTYSVKAILNGCTSSSATADVTINPVPVQPLITSNSPVCDGNPLIISVSSSPGSTFSWTGPNGFTNSTDNINISNASFNDAGIYTVTATLGSCTSTKSSTIVVNAVPVITSYNSTDPANCSTENGTIILRGLKPNTTYAVQYTKNGGTHTSLSLVSTATGIVTIPNLSAGLYENVTVALSGCPSPPVGPFDLIQPDAPSTPVAQSSSPVCEGSSVSLTATTTTTGNVSYQWTGPNSFTSNLQNVVVPNVTKQNSGNYYVTVKVNGCSSSAGVVKVEVNPTPTAPITNPVYYCIGASAVALTAYPDLGNTLNWYTSLNVGTQLGQAPIPATSTVGTTNYYVSQSSSLGCEGPRTALSVIVNDYPVITGSSYTDPPRCSTTNGTITLNGLIPNTGYTINYLKDGKQVTNTFTSNGNGAVVITPLSAGTYSQVSVNYHGCVSNLVGPFTLVESSVPPTTPTATVNNKICVGDNIALSAQSSTQGVTYSWTGPNGFFSSQQNPVINNAGTNATGKYYVVAQLNDCTSEKDSLTVQVNSIPSMPTIISPSKYCQGDNAQTLVANPASGNTIMWYTVAQNGTGSTSAPIPSTSTPGTLSFYATQLSPEGCESSRGSVAINVYAKPQASIQVNGTKCEKDNLSFTSNVQSPDAISTLAWKLSTGAVSTGASFTYQFNQSGTYSAQLVASTVHGCNDTATATVQILPAPILTTSQDFNLCLGNAAQLSVSGASSYQWTPVNSLSCATCPNPLSKPSATTKYVVQGTDANGCRSYDTVTVNVIEPFKVTVTGGDSICIGGSVLLMASGAPQYSWSPPQGLSKTNVANPVANPTVTTDYIVVGYDQYKCFTDTAHVLVAIGKEPTVNLGRDTLLSTGTQFSLNTIVTGGPIRKWSWTPTTNLSCNSCALPIATIKNNIAYSVKVTNAYGCTASDTILIKVTCDPSQVFIPNAFTPDGDGINDILMVRSKGMSSVKFFRIFNRWGELVFDRENFQPNDPKYGWDGRIKGVFGPPDVFVYTAEVICENGAVFTYKGNVSIIK